MPRKQSLLKIKPVYECVYKHVSLSILKISDWCPRGVDSFVNFLYFLIFFSRKSLVGKLILYSIDFTATTQGSLPRKHQKNSKLSIFLLFISYTIRLFFYFFYSIDFSIFTEILLLVSQHEKNNSTSIKINLNYLIPK